MTRTRTLAVSLVLFTFVAATAHASWYDDYDAGLAAARAGNWNVVVSKMSAAIKGNGTESNKARTYGAIFINYHPYYYRGVAYLNLGKYEQAIADLERTSGPGPENLGSIDTLMERAKKQLLAASEPAPEPARPDPPRQEPTRPAVTTPSAPAPAVPQIDPALRQRAASILASAKQKLQSAQQRRATSSPQYASAMSMFTDATTRSSTAKTNEELNAVIEMARNAGDLADLAAAPATPAAPAPAVAVTPTVPKSSTAAAATVADAQRQVRRALESYFAGDFDIAAREFQRLTNEMPTNPWLWAFLGASQYSQYAFEADDSYRRAAEESFQKAKRYGKTVFRNGALPERYFSKRIRKAFAETSG